MNPSEAKVEFSPILCSADIIRPVVSCRSFQAVLFDQFSFLPPPVASILSNQISSFLRRFLPLRQGFTCQEHQHVWLRQSSSFPSNPIVQFVLSFTIKVVYAISSSPRDFQLPYDEFDIKQYEDCRPSATRMDQAEVAVADVLPMSKAR